MSNSFAISRETADFFIIHFRKFDSFNAVRVGYSCPCYHSNTFLSVCKDISQPIHINSLFLLLHAHFLGEVAIFIHSRTITDLSVQDVFRVSAAFLKHPDLLAHRSHIGLHLPHPLLGFIPGIFLALVRLRCRICPLPKLLIRVCALRYTLNEWVVYMITIRAQQACHASQTAFFDELQLGLDRALPYGMSRARVSVCGDLECIDPQLLRGIIGYIDGHLRYRGHDRSSGSHSDAVMPPGVIVDPSYPRIAHLLDRLAKSAIVIESPGLDIHYRLIDDPLVILRERHVHRSVLGPDDES